MNEACLNANWIKKDLTDKKAQKFTQDVLNHMRERLSDYQEMYGDLYNLEATPAESTSYRLAKHDKKRYPDIVTASQGETPYYTNSSHLPVSYTDDVFTALDIQDELQTLYTSGTVFHTFLGEKLPDWKAAAALIRKIAENYKLPYYTLSPTYSVCSEHGYIAGEHFSCPKCGKVTEVYSRITGYYRPVQNWNDGKSQEYKERVEYDPEQSMLHFEDRGHGNVRQGTVSAPAAEAVYEDGRIVLFATKTCPKCKIAASLLEKAGIEFEKVYFEDDPDFAKKYGTRQAPTLLYIVGEDFTAFADIAGVKEFIKTTAQA
jgi:ribonucleoside-triphosphate reductase